MRGRRHFIGGTPVAVQGGAGHFSLRTNTGSGQSLLNAEKNALSPEGERIAERNQLVILNAWDRNVIPYLKAKNPKILCFVYKEAKYSRESNVEGFISTGVETQDAALKETSFLHKGTMTSGGRFLESGSAAAWSMNPGDATYQKRWVENVIADLKANGWDGVHMDDVNATNKGQGGADYLSILECESDAAWQALMKSLLEYACPRLREAGFIVCANAGPANGFTEGSPSYASIVEGWVRSRYFDRVMMEEWAKPQGNPQGPGKNYSGPNAIINTLASLANAERANTPVIAISHSTAGDEAAARYGFAVLLLGSNRTDHFFMMSKDSEANKTDGYGLEPEQIAEYAAALGEPLGAWSGSSSTLLTRSFANGLVVLNATTGSLTATFGGTYSDTNAGVTSQTETSMAAKTALILTKG